MLSSPGAVKNDINLPDKELLTDFQFYQLISRFRRGDTEAKDIIIQHNLRLVMSIAQRFSGRGEIEDLFQIGCLGLLKAIDRFDPAYNVKFSTYAVPLIIGEIKQFLRNEGPMKISRSVKEIAVKVEQTRYQLTLELGQEPTLSELVAASGLSREEIATALEATRPINSLQEIVFEEDGDSVSREHLVGGEDDRQCEWLEHYALNEVIAQLPERLRRLIELRFFQEKTQSEVAEEFGVSQVQICRLEKEALYQLRKLYLSD